MFDYYWDNLVCAEDILEWCFVFVFLLIVVKIKLWFFSYVDYVEQEPAILHHHWDIWSK